MPKPRDKGRGNSRRNLIVAALVLVGLLAVSGSAMAGQDQLKGGSVVLQHKGSRGPKFKPTSSTLPIAGGAVDPIDGSGTVNVSGTFKAMRGKGKAKVTITALNLAPMAGKARFRPKSGRGRSPSSER